MKAFVEIKEGYVESWSIITNDSYTEIDTAEELFGLIGCVKIENGSAVLDKEKQQQQIEELNRPTDLDMLKQQNAGLAKQLATSLQTQGQVQKMLAEVMIEVAAIKNGGTTNE